MVNGLIARLIGLAAGGPAPRLFTTLGRHRRLFRPWLRFASRPMPGGALPRRDSELVILRVAHRAGSPYEARHHEVLGAHAGLSSAEIAGTLGRADHAWSSRQQVLLDAADQLVASHSVDDETWDRLEHHLDGSCASPSSPGDHRFPDGSRDRWPRCCCERDSQTRNGSREDWRRRRTGPSRSTRRPPPGCCVPCRCCSTCRITTEGAALARAALGVTQA